VSEDAAVEEQGRKDAQQKRDQGVCSLFSQTHRGIALVAGRARLLDAECCEWEWEWGQWPRAGQHDTAWPAWDCMG